jgi:hypothetical protein
MDKAFSNEDISNYLNSHVKIVPYDQLINYDTIDELLEPYNKVALLYLTKQNFGHWCCLWLNKGILNFFDSYGGVPDSELKMIPQYFKAQSNQLKPALTYLMYNGPYPVNYNQYRLQKFAEGVNTCGRWVCVRLKYPDITEDKFYDLFTEDGLNPDSLVVTLT